MQAGRQSNGELAENFHALFVAGEGSPESRAAAHTMAEVANGFLAWLEALKKQGKTNRRRGRH